MDLFHTLAVAAATILDWTATLAIHLVDAADPDGWSGGQAVAAIIIGVFLAVVTLLAINRHLKHWDDVNRNRDDDGEGES